MQHTIIENIKPTGKDAKTRKFKTIWVEAAVPRFQVLILQRLHVDEMNK